MSSFQLPDGDQLTQLIVNSPRQTLRDLARNGRFIFASFVTLALYCLISAAALSYLDAIQVCSTCLPLRGHDRYAMALYATWIDVTTVGFGDVVPQTPAARGVACLNALIGLIAMGWIVALIASALTPSDDTSDEDGSDTSPSAPPKGWRRWVRTMAWPLRWLGRWIDHGRKSALRNPQVVHATLRSAREAELAKRLEAANHEVDFLRDALVRERSLVDAFVRHRAEQHPAHLSADQALRDGYLFELAQAWGKQMENAAREMGSHVKVHIWRGDWEHPLRIEVTRL